MTKERRLGKGLAALLGGPVLETVETVDSASAYEPAAPMSRSAPSPLAAESAGDQLLDLNVYEIDDNPFQPRRDFNEAEIASLAESLKEHQMLQPILVRRRGDRYQLISGERRLRAAIHAGWRTVPARIREADDRLVAELAIVENLQRKDLNPIEKALSFRRYLDEHHSTQEELASRLKIDRSTIANLMRLLELPDPVLASVRGGELSAGHARALLPLGDERLQVEFAQRILREGISVRATEQEVADRIAAEDGRGDRPAAKPRGRAAKSRHVASLEQELRAALGARVDIQQVASGRGKISIHFKDADEFERIRDDLVARASRAA